MYHVSAQGIDEHTVNVHYYYCKLLGVLAAHKPLFFNNVFRLAPQCSPVLATQKPLLFNIQTVSTVFTSTGSPETSIFQHSDCLHRNTSTGNPETSIVQHSDCLHRNTSIGNPETSIVQRCIETVQEKHQQVMDWRRVLG